MTCRFRLLQQKQSGLQLMELLIAMSILGIALTIAYPAYNHYVEKVKITTAITDIKMISEAIDRFYVANNRYPNDLSEIKMDGYLDPWGNPYQYLRIDGGGLKGKGKLRKDKSLVPVNSDFDLYSMGKDGASVPPFTAKMSRDDIVRANNGKYIGLASAY